MRSKAALRFSRQTANSCDETSEIDDGAKGCESTAYEKTPSPAAGCGCRAAFGMCAGARAGQADRDQSRSEEHTSELQSLMRISYAVFCLTKQIHTY